MEIRNNNMRAGDVKQNSNSGKTDAAENNRSGTDAELGNQILDTLTQFMTNPEIVSELEQEVALLEEDFEIELDDEPDSENSEDVNQLGADTTPIIKDVKGEVESGDGSTTESDESTPKKIPLNPAMVMLYIFEMVMRCFNASNEAQEVFMQLKAMGFAASMEGLKQFLQKSLESRDKGIEAANKDMISNIVGAVLSGVAGITSIVGSARTITQPNQGDHARGMVFTTTGDAVQQITRYLVSIGTSEAEKTKQESQFLGAQASYARDVAQDISRFLTDAGSSSESTFTEMTRTYLSLIAEVIQNAKVRH